MNIVLLSAPFHGRTAPLLILVSYLIFGFMLFLIAPFDWMLNNTTIISAYFCAIIFLFIIGFQSRIRKNTHTANPINYKTLIITGTIVAVILVIPTTQLYSGKYPWQFIELLADQTDAYSTYQERLTNSTVVDRAPVAIIRTIFYPLVFAVLPLAILNWPKLRLLERVCAVVVVMCLAVTSLARGTDKETTDLVIFVLACLMIAYFRKKNMSEPNMYGDKKSTSRSKTYLILTAFLFLSVFVFYFFVERKLGRYGGNITKVCLGSDQDICLTNSAINMSWLGDWGIFALGITAGYMSAGYYGLNLAMDLDFHSTFGTGFSPMITRFYEGLTGDTSMYLHSYTYRMRAFGWSDENAWSTLMVWFANDVGFFGALIVLFLLSMLFGASWRDAVVAKDDRAAIVFVILFVMFIYLPANNQIGQSLDSSFAFLFWLFRWQYMKFRGPRLSTGRQPS